VPQVQVVGSEAEEPLGGAEEVKANIQFPDGVAGPVV
jgi:hypothetical protein